MARGSKPLRRRARDLVELWVGRFDRHRLLTYASAIAFDVFKAGVALVLLGFGVLGALHERRVWEEQLAPHVKPKVLRAVFDGIDATVDKILSRGSAGLVAFAFLLALWYVSGSVRACMDAMNEIYEAEDDRPTWKRWVVSLALGLAIEVCIVGTVLLLMLTAGVGEGAAVVPIEIGRWLGAVLLVGLAVNLLVRFGPAKPRTERWASLGTALVVAVWLAASVVFAWFVSSVGFRSPTGSLAVFLVLGGYLYTSSIIFLVGVELDELLRQDATRGERGILDLIAGRV